MLQTLAPLATRRRLAATAVAMPLLAAGYVWAAGVPAGELAAAWLVLDLLGAALGAAVLAAYLPASGWRPDLGCSPCARSPGSVWSARCSRSAATGPAWLAPAWRPRSPCTG